MRNPWGSQVDRAFVTEAMKTGELFPMIANEDTRMQILGSLQRIKYRIPSLYTFFEDTKWLEPCAKVMRKLLPTGCKRSIREGFRSMYDPTRQSDCITIETRAGPLETRGLPDNEIVNLGYVDLWLFAWRHFPELSAMLPRRDTGKSKPPARASNEQCWSKFAQIAQNAGFQSGNITLILEQDSDVKMTRAFLDRVRPEEFYSIAPTQRATAINSICALLESMRERPQDIDVSGSEATIPVHQRCGRPYESIYKLVKSRFFFRDVYAPKKPELSPFTINRDIFQAFFGMYCPYNMEDTPTTPGDGDMETTLSTTTHATDLDQFIRRETSQEMDTQLRNDSFLAPNDNTGSRQATDTESNSRTAQGVMTLFNPGSNALTVPRAMKSSLVDDWHSCNVGDILLIDLSAGNRYLCSSAELNVPPPQLPHHIIVRAEQNFQIVRRGAKKATFIQVEYIAQYGKDCGHETQYDGVVFVSDKDQDRLSDLYLQCKRTEDRLERVSQVLNNPDHKLKRRRYG